MARSRFCARSRTCTSSPRRARCGCTTARPSDVRGGMTDALGARRAVRRRRGLGRRTDRRRDPQDRGDEPAAQLPRHRQLRAGARDDAGRRAVRRRADAREGPERDGGNPHDVLVARVRELRARERLRGRAPDPRCRLRHPRQVEHAGVRDHSGDRVRPERRLPQPLGSQPHTGRLVGRRGGSRRGRAIPLAHGSDGGGSIRIPASCCGLFGIKPSRGRVSAAPLVSGSLELSQSGPISVTVRDAAAFLDVLAGYEPGDPHWPPPPNGRSSRRSAPTQAGCGSRSPPTRRPAPVDPRLVGVARAAADALAGLGHEVIDATLQWVDEDLLTGLRSSGRSGRRSIPVATARCSSRSTGCSPTRRCDLERRLRAGGRWFQGFARRVVTFWADVDMVLTPALGCRRSRSAG